MVVWRSGQLVKWGGHWTGRSFYVVNVRSGKGLWPKSRVVAGVDPRVP